MKGKYCGIWSLNIVIFFTLSSSLSFFLPLRCKPVPHIFRYSSFLSVVWISNLQEHFSSIKNAVQLRHGESCSVLIGCWYILVNWRESPSWLPPRWCSGSIVTFGVCALELYFGRRTSNTPQHFTAHQSLKYHFSFLCSFFKLQPIWLKKQNWKASDTEGGLKILQNQSVVVDCQGRCGSWYMPTDKMIFCTHCLEKLPKKQPL